MHWDHVGEPRDFPHSTFVVGNGACDLLKGNSSNLRGSHSFFEKDLLPNERTVELPSPARAISYSDLRRPMWAPVFSQPWQSYSNNLLRVLDIFQDGSVLVVDAPGHLPGHLNLLVRTHDPRASAAHRVYLAGDACHDRRIMRGQREIGEWKDDAGHLCCIHANKKEAEAMIDRIRRLEQDGVEIIFAHDREWEESSKNAWRFFGAR